MMEASRLGRYLVAVIVALGLVGAIHNASRTGHGQEPPAAAAGPGDQRPAAFTTVRPAHADRWDDLDHRPGQPCARCPHRSLPSRRPRFASREPRPRSPSRATSVCRANHRSSRLPKQERAEDEADDAIGTVKIHLLQEAEVRDFTVKRSSIKSIEYFEDILLAEGDRLVLARDFARAFECFLRVKSRNPGWTGLDDHVNRLLFAEGSTALLAGDHERGLRLLASCCAESRFSWIA